MSELEQPTDATTAAAHVAALDRVAGELGRAAAALGELARRLEP